MTELEWRVCDDVRRLVRSANGLLTDRKNLLWWVACCRLAWTSLTDEDRSVVTQTADFLRGTKSQKPALGIIAPVALRVLLQHDIPRGTHADVFREIVGNPFRPVVFDPSWRTSDVTLLARRVYDAPDFGATPILADALQDAGCDADDLLAHLRDPKQVHYRGCWALDLVLGHV